jgi:hypothetical protein
MFLASIVVGCVVAYAFGPKHGVRAAGAALAILLVAQFFPPLKLYVHILLAIGVAVAAAQAAGRPPHEKSKRVVELATSLVKRWIGGRKR